MDRPVPFVCFDFNRHSCIVVRVTDRKVFFVPMEPEGLELSSMSGDKFRERYVPDEYPVGRAVAHYLAAAEILPMSTAARNQLEPHTVPLDIAPVAIRAATIAFVNTHRKVSRAQRLADVAAPSSTADQENNMATTKKPAAKKAALAKKPAAKKAAPAKKSVTSAEPKARKPGVTQLIKDLLLAGKDTETICMEISAQFPASKAGTKEVSWCRSQLRKEGYEV